MNHGRRVRLGLLGLILVIASAACSSTPAATPTGPSGTPECGIPLTAKDMEGGFLAGEVSAPASGTIVEAALATGAGGPQLTGRTILFVGAFRGALPVTVAGGAMFAVEAATPLVDAEGCSGSVRIAAFADVLDGGNKGDAFAEADLGGITVGGASSSCTALPATPGSIAVECPSIGIRIGSQASTGTLWLRFRAVGQPTTVAAMPAWVDQLTGAATPTETTGPGLSMGGTISLDGEAFAILPLEADLNGVFIEPQDGGTKVGYRGTFSFELGDYYSQLSIGIADYDGPGVHAMSTFVQLSKVVSVDGGLPQTIVFRGADCRVEVADGELRGSTSCTLTAEDPDAGAVEVVADWTVASATRSVGPSVLVHWTLGGAYVSEGQATVLTSANTPLDPSIRRVLEVRVGHPGTFDLLRLDIFGFTGEGTYLGDAVHASIQDVINDSPNLRMNADPSDGIPAPNGEPWGPVFGECTATVADDGHSGSIRCTGVAGFEDTPSGGSTTLFATWAPA